MVLHEVVIGERPSWDEPLGDHRDPEVQQVLELAASMRDRDPAKRPSAREVERACRDLRHALAEPYLRDWAEESVRCGLELPPDPLVGQTLRVIPTEETLYQPRPSPLEQLWRRHRAWLVPVLPLD